jgi:protein transport protein HofC
LFICTIELLVSVLMLLIVLPECIGVYQFLNAPLPGFIQGPTALVRHIDQHRPIFFPDCLGMPIFCYCRWLHPQTRWRRRLGKSTASTAGVSPVD